MSKAKDLNNQDERKALEEKALTRLDYDIYYLLKHYDFVAHIFNRAKKLINYDVPVAAMNLNKYGDLILYINPHGYLKYPLEQRIFIDIHELKHLLNDHIPRSKNFKDHALFNVCADIEINPFIENEIAKMPPDLLIPKTYDLPEKLTAEQYYEILENRGIEIKMDDDFKSGATGNFLSNIDDINNDSHNGNESSSLAPDFQDLHPNWDDPDFPENEHLSKEMVKEIIEDAINKSSGKIPNFLQEDIENLLKPKVDWKSILTNFVESKISPTRKRTWSRENRILGDLVMGSLKKRILNLLVLIDTSTSISTNQLREFFGEIDYLYELGVDITIIEFTTRVNNIYKYEPGKFPNPVRGGTHFTPIFDYISNGNPDNPSEHLEDEPDAIFVLTDGEATAPNDFNVDTLWLLTPDGSIPIAENGKPINWGQILFMEN